MIPEFFRLQDKVAVVTGAGNPLARAIGEALAEAGADVVAVSHRAEAAQALAASARGHGRQSLAVTADMTRAADVRRVAQEATRRFGKMDILLAGEDAVLAGPLGDTLEDQWDTVMSVNAKSYSSASHCRTSVSEYEAPSPAAPSRRRAASASEGESCLSLTMLSSKSSIVRPSFPSTPRSFTR